MSAYKLEEMPLETPEDAANVASHARKIALHTLLSAINQLNMKAIEIDDDAFLKASIKEANDLTEIIDAIRKATPKAKPKVTRKVGSRETRCNDCGDVRKLYSSCQGCGGH